MKRSSIRSAQNEPLQDQVWDWERPAGGKTYTAQLDAPVPAPAALRAGSIGGDRKFNLAWLAALTGCLALTLVLSLMQLMHQKESDNRQQRFLAALVTIEEAKTALQAMEAGNRGFLLTGKPAVRATFVRGRDSFSARYKRLIEANSGQLQQQDRLKTLKNKLDRWFALYNPIIQQRQRAVKGMEIDSAVASELRVSAHEQEIILACDELFGEIQFLLDEIRSTQEAQFYDTQQG